MIDPDPSALLAACGSPGWVSEVRDAAPYHDLDDLIAVGEKVWWAAGPQDWRDALAAHPRIGDRPPAGTQERREQSGAEDAAAETMAAIAAGNREYEERFGFTYVVRASGRSATEMLAMLHDRLGNDPDAELRVAAGQQWEITVLRLRQWDPTPA
jgi:allantoicase